MAGSDCADKTNRNMIGNFPYCAGEDSTAVTPGAGDWFVLHTRPRQEKAVARDLTARRIHHFLPLTSSVRFHGRKRIETQVPLFAGYVFLRGSACDAWTLDRLGRLVQVIAIADQDRIDDELDAIRHALEAEVPLAPHPRVREGSWVEVVRGPLRGVKGIVQRKSRRARMVLQVEGLAQASSLEIDAGLLEPCEPGPIPRA